MCVISRSFISGKTSEIVIVSRGGVAFLVIWDGPFTFLSLPRLTE